MAQLSRLGDPDGLEELLPGLVRQALQDGAAPLLVASRLNQAFCAHLQVLDPSALLRLLEHAFVVESGQPDKQVQETMFKVRNINLGVLAVQTGERRKAESIFRKVFESPSRSEQSGLYSWTAGNNLAMLLQVLDQKEAMLEVTYKCIHGLELTLFAKDFGSLPESRIALLVNLYLLLYRALLKLLNKEVDSVPFLKKLTPEAKLAKALSYLANARKIVKKYLRREGLLAAIQKEEECAKRKLQRLQRYLLRLECLLDVSQISQSAVTMTESKPVFRNMSKTLRKKRVTMRQSSKSLEQPVRCHLKLIKIKNADYTIKVVQRSDGGVSVLLLDSDGSVLVSKELSKAHCGQLLKELDFEDALTLTRRLQQPLNLPRELLHYLSVAIRESVLDMHLYCTPQGEEPPGEWVRLGTPCKLFYHRHSRKEYRVVVYDPITRSKDRIDFRLNEANVSLSCVEQKTLLRTVAQAVAEAKDSAQLAQELKETARRHWEFDGFVQRRHAMPEQVRALTEQVVAMLTLNRLGQVKAVETGFIKPDKRKIQVTNSFTDQARGKLLVQFVVSQAEPRLVEVPLRRVEGTLGLGLAGESTELQQWVVSKFLEQVEYKGAPDSHDSFQKEKANLVSYEVAPLRTAACHSFMVDFETRCSLLLALTRYSAVGLFLDVYRLEQGSSRHLILLEEEPPELPGTFKLGGRVRQRLEIESWQKFYSPLLKRVGFRVIQQELLRQYFSAKAPLPRVLGLDALLNAKSLAKFADKAALRL